MYLTCIMSKLQISFYSFVFLYLAVVEGTKYRIDDCDECKISTYKPAVPFNFVQQIYWDGRNNITTFGDAGATSASVFRFDWATKTIVPAVLTKGSNSTPLIVSFTIPSKSDPDKLVVGVDPYIYLIKRVGLSKTATVIKKVTSHSSSDGYKIDRGGTLSDGTIITSFLPQNHCNPGMPEYAVGYLDLKTKTLKNGVFPGYYSNGFAFNAKTQVLYVGDDCLASVLAYKYNSTSKTFFFLNVVWSFPGETASTNYPSGFALDTCGNLYMGDHGSGRVFYIDTKAGKLLKTIKVPGTHVTAVAIIGPKLDTLAVTTGTAYHDAYGNLESTSTDPGDGRLYLLPLKTCSYDPKCAGSQLPYAAGF